MKRIVLILLVIAMALSIVSCGAVNKNEVAVLWHDQSDDFTVALADAVDRGMYIENIKYEHYDAKGDASMQIQQAKDAIGAKAAALLVNTVLEATATEIVALAKEANIPVVFICSNISNEIISSYDKCAAVELDSNSLYETLGEKIASDLLDDYSSYDRNGDGKISYVAFGLSSASVSTINKKLTEKGKSELEAVNYDSLLSEADAIDALFKGYDGSGNKVNATPVELILTDDDTCIEDLLLTLRSYELNYKKLVTHFIPLYTVGNAANAGDLIDSTVQEEKDAYSVMNAIDDGFLSASALEDDDTLAESAAKILRNFIKEKEVLKGISESIIDSDRKVVVEYTIYG